MADSVLKRRGTSSRPKALALLQKHSISVHLLLTDMVMPEMNGKTCIWKF